MNTQATIQMKSFPSIKAPRIPKKELEFFSSNPELKSTDFGAFYVDHREFIDKIIAVWTNDYQNKYDVEDIRQEVLYRLQVNDVLTQYNPAQGKLNVFLTMKIKNYIRHAVRDLASLFLSDEEEFDEYRHTVYNKTDLFDEVCFQDALSNLKAKVKPSVWEFVCKLQRGLTSTEIAEEENVSRSSINFKYMQVLKSKAVRKLFL
jgi:DNA-directed RNA polymerase specialized sigma24 family protein